MRSCFDEDYLEKLKKENDIYDRKIKRAKGDTYIYTFMIGFYTGCILSLIMWYAVGV